MPRRSVPLAGPLFLSVAFLLAQASAQQGDTDGINTATPLPTSSLPPPALNSTQLPLPATPPSNATLATPPLNTTLLPTPAGTVGNTTPPAINATAGTDITLPPLPVNVTAPPIGLLPNATSPAATNGTLVLPPDVTLPPLNVTVAPDLNPTGNNTDAPNVTRLPTNPTALPSLPFPGGNAFNVTLPGNSAAPASSPGMPEGDDGSLGAGAVVGILALVAGFLGAAAWVLYWVQKKRQAAGGLEFRRAGPFDRESMIV